MTSQLVIFRAFFSLFFVPSTLNLKKVSRKSTNKKILALVPLFSCDKFIASVGVLQCNSCFYSCIFSGCTMSVAVVEGL